MRWLTVTDSTARTPAAPAFVRRRPSKLQSIVATGRSDGYLNIFAMLSGYQVQTRTPVSMLR